MMFLRNPEQVTQLLVFFQNKSLLYDPVKRISCKAMINHPYFNDLDKSVLPAGYADFPN